MQSMLGIEFNEFFESLANLKKFFLGVYSINTCPRKIPFNHFLICNTDISSGSGLHWFALFRFSREEIECFDSLGVDEHKLEVLKSLKLNGISNLIFNKTQVQANESTSCGQFCLYFLYERLHNLDFSFHELMNEIFVNDLRKNEEQVQNFTSEQEDGTLNTD